MLIYDNPRQNTSGIVLPALCPPNGLSQSEISARILCFGSIRFFIIMIFCVCVWTSCVIKNQNSTSCRTFSSMAGSVFFQTFFETLTVYEQCALYTYTIHIILIIIKSSIVYENVRIESGNFEVTSDRCRIVICSTSRVCSTTIEDS